MPITLGFRKMQADEYCSSAYVLLNLTSLLIDDYALKLSNMGGFQMAQACNMGFAKMRADGIRVSAFCNSVELHIQPDENLFSYVHIINF